MLAPKNAGQRIILCLDDNAVSDPLPKLGLRRPKLLTVMTKHECRSFLFFLLFLSAHWWLFPISTRRPLRALLGSLYEPKKVNAVPEGSLSREAASVMFAALNAALKNCSLFGPGLLCFYKRPTYRSFNVKSVNFIEYWKSEPLLINWRGLSAW